MVIQLSTDIDTITNVNRWSDDESKICYCEIISLPPPHPPPPQKKSKNGKLKILNSVPLLAFLFSASSTISYIMQIIRRHNYSLFRTFTDFYDFFYIFFFFLNWLLASYSHEPCVLYLLLKWVTWAIFETGKLFFQRLSFHLPHNTGAISQFQSLLLKRLRDDCFLLCSIGQLVDK